MAARTVAVSAVPSGAVLARVAGRVAACPVVGAVTVAVVAGVVIVGGVAGIAGVAVTVIPRLIGRVPVLI